MSPTDSAGPENATRRAAPARWHRPPGILIAVGLGIGLLVLAAWVATQGSMETAPSWPLTLAQVEEALASKNVSRAVLLWHGAYTDALASRRWDALLAVAGTYRRLGQVGGFRQAADAKAREIYLNAVFRARHQGSLDGVLRVAAAFATLGDDEVVERCLQMAERLARAQGDATAYDRVVAERERLTGRRIGATTQPDLDPFPLLFPDEIGGP